MLTFLAGKEEIDTDRTDQNTADECQTTRPKDSRRQSLDNSPSAFERLAPSLP